MLDLPTDIDEFRRAVRQFVQAGIARRAAPARARASSPTRCRSNGTNAWPPPACWYPRRRSGAGAAGTWRARWRLTEEMALNDAPELNSVTFDMIGPVLMRYGNPEQQARFLPAIASGRQWWCQGYSEPNAGSGPGVAQDPRRARRGRLRRQRLESGRCVRAVRRLGFLLARTDAEARPQAGISFLLIDMKTPGITVRPIVGIHGWVVFNEVFPAMCACRGRNIGEKRRLDHRRCCWSLSA